MEQSTNCRHQKTEGLTPSAIRAIRIRLAIDDSRGALARGEEVPASDYAAAHPECKRELLFEMSRAATMLSDQQRVESIAERLDALSKPGGDSLAAAYARIVRARSLAEVEPLVGLDRLITENGNRDELRGFSRPNVPVVDGIAT